MAKFEITAPNGQTLEIEGDAPPSEAELDEIFAQTKTSGNIEQQAQNNAPKRPTAKGIDLTPSGISRAIASATTAPIKMLTDKKTFRDAWNEEYNFLKNLPGQEFSDTLTDIGAYAALPILKGGATTNAIVQGGLIGGLEGLKNEASLGSVAKGGLFGGALGGTISGILPWAGAKAGQGINNLKGAIVKSPLYKNTMGQLADTFANVPKEVFEIAYDDAINNGGTILKGQISKNPYGKGTQLYRNAIDKIKQAGEYNKTIFKNLGQRAKEKLQAKIKPEEYYDNELYKLGQRYLGNKDAIEAQLGDKVSEAINNLPEETGFKAGDLKNELDRIYNQYSASGDKNLNVAYNEAGNIYDNIAGKLNTENNLITPKQLVDINKNISAKTKWNLEDAKTQNQILEQLYGTYANKLNKLSPELASANSAYAKLMELEKQTGGLNPSTIAGKLKDYNSSNQILSGANTAFKNVDNLVDPKLRILDSVQKLNAERAAQEKLQKDLGSSIFNDISRYENAPFETQDALARIAPDELKQYQYLKRLQDEETQILAPNILPASLRKNAAPLLDNSKHELTQNAIDYLQNRTGVNFMDELKKARMQEILNSDIYSTGGGYGSTQGKKNLLADQLGNLIPSPLKAVGKYQLQRPSFYKEQLLNASKILNNPKSFEEIYKSLGQKIPESIRRLLTIGALEQLPPQGGISQDVYLD